MEITAATLDDLLYGTYSKLLNQPFINTATRTDKKGPFSEIFGVLLELTNPRARLSLSDSRGKIFSSLGELLWYFSKTDDLDFIKYYIPAYKEESADNVTVYGGYGPRLFNAYQQYNQIENVVTLLKKKATSKKAIIQLFEPRDIEYELTGKTGSIPCTCSLHFLQRDNKLHMMTQMRSNDAHLGLPHDIFAFTMIQEYIATRLNYDLGVYKHSVASLHLYETSKGEIEEYREEGLQTTRDFMPPMPQGDQTSQIEILLEIERNIRTNQTIDIPQYNLNPYWEQLAYLLEFYRADKSPRDIDTMEKVSKFVKDKNYSHILERKIRSAKNP